ncbi:MAG TPA: hypothetical protein VJP79_03635 [Nitrososphaera sp.]|nr:hypothetical protein [Nitrososphaera sp.]
MNEENKKPAVIDWDETIHKNVRSKDGEPVGSIVGVSGDSVFIETIGSRGQFTIPKQNVEQFNGAEITLTLSAGELEKFSR